MQVLTFFGRLAPCLVGLEACGSAHYWAREIAALGHNVKMMPPAYADLIQRGIRASFAHGERHLIDAEQIEEVFGVEAIDLSSVDNSDLACVADRGKCVVDARH